MHRLVNPLFSILLLLATAAFTGCEQRYYFSQYADVDPEKWKSTDTLNFTMDSKEANPALTYYLSVRHQKDYEFSNLWVKVLISGNKADTSFRYEIPLFKNDGKPYGKSSGSLCTQTVPLKTDFPLQKKGIYTIRIVQLMRKDPLDGISAIGILADHK
jgi:gliding motility-associated lipoprotein GldH